MVEEDKWLHENEIDEATDWRVATPDQYWYPQPTSLPTLIRLFRRLNYGLWKSGYNSQLELRSRLPIANVVDQRLRRGGRLSLRRSRAMRRQALEQWECVKHVRPQLFDPSLLTALIDEARTWPEVLDVREDGGSIQIQFWPVFFDTNTGDDSYGPVEGLTIPMQFRISPLGEVTWTGDCSAHPHAYSSSHDICHGDGGNFHTGLVPALTSLRDWWVGTSGDLANQHWQGDSASWWQEHRGRFFAEHPAAKVIYAPQDADEDGEAVTEPLTPDVLDRLLRRTANPTCDICGYTSEGFIVCGGCLSRVGTCCWFSDRDLCVNCIEPCTVCGAPSDTCCNVCDSPLCPDHLGGDTGATCPDCARDANRTEESDPTIVAGWELIEQPYVNPVTCSWPYDACSTVALYFRQGVGRRCPSHVPRRPAGLSVAEGWTDPENQPPPLSARRVIGTLTYTAQPEAQPCTYLNCGRPAWWFNADTGNRRCVIHAGYHT
jgi:hypothetical protein